VDFAPTDEQRAIRDTARAFITREVVPLEAEMRRRDRAGAPPLTRDELRELQRKAAGFGFWGLSTPEEYGGMDLPALTQCLVWTEIGRTPVPFRFGGEADNILYRGNESQRAEYLRPTIAGDRLGCFALTEPGAGSDLAGIALRARRSGADWLLSGEKTFITHGDEADYAIVIARAGESGPTAFLVDRAMGWTSHPIPTMGSWHAPASLRFDDVRVPGANVLGPVGEGFALAQQWVVRGRYVIPAQAVGIAERCLALAVEHANTRVTFGHPLAQNQAIQWMIADSAAEIEATRWLSLRAAWAVDAGQPARHPAAIAKLYGAGMVNRVVDRAMQIHGGMGYTRDLPIEWWYRAVRVLRILEGSDEMQRMIISRDLLRGYEKMGGHLA
jgi:alkylation response protein AidB-like acyl-CoA dehydrogenase